MIELLAEVVHEDTKFAEMVKKYWGDRFLESLWVLISDWFRHDNSGEKLEDEQVWFVD
jgi:acyl-coenzyme A synthetase/AMP-(fatty) acid ligase